MLNGLIGNLSNPSINRWGLNLFWYRYWYNDKIPVSYMQQDVTFEKLLYTYLLFGILTPHYPFISNYWLQLFPEDSAFNMVNYNEKYYRNVEIKGSFLKELTLLRLRFKVKHFYFSKIWILRFQGWILMNFYSFQPLKKKKSKLKTYFKDIDAYKVTPLRSSTTLKLTKLFFKSFFVMQKLTTPPIFNSYRF